MFRIKEAIVVEGRYDKNTLSQVVDTLILETAGFGIFKNPEQMALLRKAAEGPVFTLEEHVRTGGFGAAVCDFCARERLCTPARIFALPEEFITHGSRELLLDKLGLSADIIAEEIIGILQ